MKSSSIGLINDYSIRVRDDRLVLFRLDMARRWLVGLFYRVSVERDPSSRAMRQAGYGDNGKTLRQVSSVEVGEIVQADGGRNQP